LTRVAKALLQLVESVGLRALHGPSVELHVSQRELGNMAGGSRESMNKIFQNWHRRGRRTPLGAGRVKTRLQCVIGLRKIQMPWKGCAATGLQALIAAIKALTPRMAMTRLRL
jgi:Crp-like helix-turn-helix domain